ncbi:MAG: DUF3833 family protein [Parvularcula sp.]
MIKYLASILAVFALAACGTAAPPVGPSLDPAAFFSGPTRGDGVLVRRDGSIDQTFYVNGMGRVTPDGELILEQTIHWSGGKVDQRAFRLSQVGPGEWRGSLDGARGNAQVTVSGNHMILRYALADVRLGRMQQHLYLTPDEQRLINEGTVRVGGVTVRRLHEIIEKVGETE